MKLTEKSLEVLEYVRDNGGRVSIDELVNAIGRAKRSIGANVTDLTNKKLMVRDKVVEGENEVTYAVVTDEGKHFVQEEDTEE